MQRFLAAGVAVAMALFGSANADAKGPICDLTHYVFADQQGHEAIVQTIYECWGYYNRDTGISSGTNKCLSAVQTLATLLRMPAKTTKGWSGSRIFVVRYQGKTYDWSENAIDGSPWYWQDVDQPSADLRSMLPVRPRTAYFMIGMKVPRFTFHDGGFLDETAALLYGPMLGKDFKFKRCRP